MGRLDNGSGHSAVGEEESDAVLASVTQKAESRFTVQPLYLGVQSQGAGVRGQGSDLSTEEGGTGDWAEWC